MQWRSLVDEHSREQVSTLSILPIGILFSHPYALFGEWWNKKQRFPQRLLCPSDETANRDQRNKRNLIMKVLGLCFSWIVRDVPNVLCESFPNAQCEVNHLLCRESVVYSYSCMWWKKIKSEKGRMWMREASWHGPPCISGVSSIIHIMEEEGMRGAGFMTGVPQKWDLKKVSPFPPFLWYISFFF